MPVGKLIGCDRVSTMAGGGRAQDRALIGPFNLPEVACVGLGSDWMLKFARTLTGGGLVGSNDVSAVHPGTSWLPGWST